LLRGDQGGPPTYPAPRARWAAPSHPPRRQPAKAGGPRAQGHLAPVWVLMLSSRPLVCHFLAIVAVARGLASDLDFVFNSEAPTGVEVQSHEPILLTEGTLHTIGVAQDTSAEGVNLASGTSPASGALQNVCERTRAVLIAQAPSKEASEGRLPGAPVYHECMAALAPVRAQDKANNAIDTLSDCMALVNALVKQSQTGAGNGGGAQSPCLRISSMLEAHPAPAAKAPTVASTTAAATATVAFAADRSGPVAYRLKAADATAGAGATDAAQRDDKATLAAQTAEAMDLVAEAMTDVCSQTVHQVEADIKRKEDAMKLGNAVSPVCEENARKRLAGVSGAPSSLLREWCHQLDGRLTLALQTGFLFALEPEEAERLAGEANPYATTTRRLFCARFIDSLRHQAEAGGLYLGGAAPVPPSPKPPGREVGRGRPQPSEVINLSKHDLDGDRAVTPYEFAKKARASSPPTTSLQSSATTAPPAVVLTVSKPLQPSPAASDEMAVQRSVSAPRTAVDMLHLVQALSNHDEWKTACNSLVSRLTSEEGSVLEEFALGDDETPDGTKVLTFNAEDQAQLRKCSAELKVLAVRTGAIVADASTGRVSLLETEDSFSAGYALTSETADAVEALVDSPWSYDACADMAHSFLTAHLAHPDLKSADFCPLYANDLRQMHGRPESSAEAAKQDLEKLRVMAKRRPLARRTQVAAAPTTSAPVAAAKTAITVSEAKRPNSAFLIKTVAARSQVPEPGRNADAGQDRDGLNFWSGMLQD